MRRWQRGRVRSRKQKHNLLEKAGSLNGKKSWVHVKMTHEAHPQTATVPRSLGHGCWPAHAQLGPRSSERECPLRQPGAVLQGVSAKGCWPLTKSPEGEIAISPATGDTQLLSK